MKQQKAEYLYRRSRDGVDLVGALLADALHYLLLLAIGVAIVWSAASTIISIVARGNVAIRDILLLFIYLELVAMIGIHFRTKRLPVRFLIYVAITALTRLLIVDVQADHKANIGVILISGAILILAIGVFVIRYGSYKFPLDRGLRIDHTDSDEDEGTD